MDKISVALSTAGVAVAIAAGAIAHATAQQMVLTTSDSRTVMGGGPPDRPLSAGTGLIVGQAIDASTRRPIADALVTLSSSGYLPAQVLADNEGRFVFRDLPAARFNLTVTKSGYADGAYGRVRPNGPTQSLELIADQKVSDVSMPLWKFGVIAGTVLDENGDPLVAAPVRVLREAVVAGKRQLQQAGSTSTDDRGMYRISSLVPGDYIVALPMTPNTGSPLDGLLGPLADRLTATATVAAVARGGGGGGGQNVFNLQMAPDTGGGDSATAG